MNRRKLISWLLALPIIPWSGIAAAKESELVYVDEFTGGWVKDYNGKDCYLIILNPTQHKRLFGRTNEQVKETLGQIRAKAGKKGILRFVVNYD